MATGSEIANPLQQRAAAAAQVLLAPERKVAPHEIQNMLEKNEAALRGWNQLHKQQPPKTSVREHKEWVRRCLAFRQQIASRLEVLASLADKQIAQEDEKSGKRVSPSTSVGTVGATPNVTSSAMGMTNQPSSGASTQGYMSAQTSTMNGNQVVINSSGSIASTASTTNSAPMMAPTVPAETPPTMFPEPPMPTMGLASTSTNMFFPTGQNTPMQTSPAFSSTSSMSTSGANTASQGFAMSSGAQTFTPNAYMASTSGPVNSSAPFMNQQNFMMGGMMNQQQFMAMAMPMDLTSAGNTMYGSNNSYNMSPAGSGGNNNANSSVNNASSNNFPVDPFNAPLGFAPNAGFGFPMAGMPQMMAPMTGANFAVPGSSMMPNNFGYGEMSMGVPTSSQAMMLPTMSTQQFQNTQTGLQPFHQQQQGNQFSQNLSEDETGSLTAPPDFGDPANNVNIFEGLSDDAFFPMQ